jgi:hypothetical protein
LGRPYPAYSRNPKPPALAGGRSQTKLNYKILKDRDAVTKLLSPQDIAAADAAIAAWKPLPGCVDKKYCKP